MNNHQAAVRTAPLAVWSLVLGLLGLVLIGPLGTIPAVICGHLAIPRIRRASGTLTGRGLALTGLVAGYLGIVLHLVILPAVLLPAISTARNTARQVQCLNNLRQISLAATMYSIENEGRYPPDLQSLTQYITDAEVFVCPAKQRRPGRLEQVESWSDYILVPDADAKGYGKLVLAFSKPDCYPGRGGTVAFVDGHVQWYPLEEYRDLTDGLMR